MSGFKAFCRKEVIEGHRSKRVYILMAIFVVFGMASPVLARYMQEIMSLAMGSGAPVLTSEPVWTDSWSQFYSNLSQMGGICILLLFMSSVSGEKIGKTASLTLTKNLTPAEFILAKYCVAAGIAAVAFLPAVLVCWGYTYYLFGFAGQPQSILIGAGAYLMFVLDLVAVTILAGTVSGTWVGSAILAFGGFLALIVSSYLPIVGAFLPGRLLLVPVSAMSGVYAVDELRVQMAVGAVTVCICIRMAVRVLKSQEL